GAIGLWAAELNDMGQSALYMAFSWCYLVLLCTIPPVLTYREALGLAGTKMLQNPTKVAQQTTTEVRPAPVGVPAPAPSTGSVPVPQPPDTPRGDAGNRAADTTQPQPPVDNAAGPDPVRPDVTAPAASPPVAAPPPGIGLLPPKIGDGASEDPVT